jgi:hypothetical protein
MTKHEFRLGLRAMRPYVLLRLGVGFVVFLVAMSGACLAELLEALRESANPALAFRLRTGQHIKYVKGLRAAHPLPPPETGGGFYFWL